MNLMDKKPLSSETILETTIYMKFDMFIDIYFLKET